MSEPLSGLVLASSTSVRETEFPGIDLRGETNRNPYGVYLAGLGSDSSRRAMAACLDRIARLWTLHTGATALDEPAGRHFPWHQLRHEHTAAIRLLVCAQHTEEGSAWAPSYINKHLTALRKTLHTAWLLGGMTADEYHRAREVRNVKGLRLQTGRYIAAAERQALVEACLADATAIGVRDGALFAALYSTGCRREELANATRADYRPGERTLIVIGKGNKQRAVYLTEPAAVVLGQWLTLAPKTGPLFPRVDRWGNVLPEHLTPDAIGKVVTRRAVQAGIPDVTAHDFRRTFISDLLAAGVDIATVQALAGHESATTTAGYDRRPAAARRAAVDLLAA